MATVREVHQACETKAEQHRLWADRAYGLGTMFRESTADRRGDFGRANAAASRAFLAAADAHWAAADAHDIAAICNTPTAGADAWDVEADNEDEFEYANEASHAAKEAFRAAIRAAKATRETDSLGMTKEIDAADAAEQAARLVREAEDVAERCLNGR